MDMVLNNYYLGAVMALRSLRDRSQDDRGLDDAPAKLLWIAGGVVIAIAAVAFAINVFDQTKDDYQDPVIPAVDGELGG